MTNALRSLAKSSGWNFNSVTRGWIRNVSDGFYEEASSLTLARDGDAPGGEL
jgi:hypothetical protein